MSCWERAGMTLKSKETAGWAPAAHPAVYAGGYTQRNRRQSALSVQKGMPDNPPVILLRKMTAPFSVTPQKYEPTAMDFWLVERMHASAASRYTRGPLNGGFISSFSFCQRRGYRRRSSFCSVCPLRFQGPRRSAGSGLSHAGAGNGWGPERPDHPPAG